MAKMFIVCIFIKIGNLVGFSWFAITKKKDNKFCTYTNPINVKSEK